MLRKPILIAMGLMIALVLALGLASSVEASVHITNMTRKPVVVFLVGAGGKVQRLYEIAAGQGYSTAAPAGTELGFTQDGQQIGEVYHVTGSGEEAIVVPYHVSDSQTAPAMPQSSQAQTGIVNGTNVAEVMHSQGKFLKQGKGWVEVNSAGAVTFNFVETGRDEWSVYLRDPTRNVMLQIDLYQKKVYFSDASTKKTALYNITGASAGNAPAASSQNAPQVADQNASQANGANNPQKTPSTAKPAGSALPMIVVANDTKGIVTVIAVDANQNQKALFDVAPGKTAAGPVATGTLLGFSQNGAWLGDPYTTLGKANETVVVSSQQKAVPAAPPVVAAGSAKPQLNIINQTPGNVAVIAIGTNEQQTLIATIAAGKTLAQTFPSGAVLGFSQNDQWLGDAYTVQGKAGESVNVVAPQQAAAAPAAPASSTTAKADPSKPALSITNRSGDEIVVIAIDENNQQRLVTKVPAGQTSVQNLPPGTTLGFSQNNAWLGDPYTVVGKGVEKVAVPYSQPAAAASATPPATNGDDDPSKPHVKITNTTNAEISVIAIDGQQQQTLLRTIPAGGSVNQAMSPGIILGFSQNDQWLGDPYQSSGKGNESISVPYRALSELQTRMQGPGSVMMEFKNTSSAALQVAAVNAQNQAEILASLPAGKISRLKALPGTPLYFYQAGQNDPVGDGFVVPTAATKAPVELPYNAEQAAIANSPVVAAQTGAGSIAITYTNTTSTTVLVVYVDDKNDATTLYKIPAGQKVTQRALPKSTLWFFQEGADKPVGDAVVVANSDMQVTIPYDGNAAAALALKQAQENERARILANTGSWLRVNNHYKAKLSMVAAGKDGTRVDLDQIAAGASQQYQVAKGTELFFLPDNSDQPVGDSYVVTDLPVDAIDLPYQKQGDLWKSLSGNGAVSVPMHNTTDHVITVMALPGKDKDPQKLFEIFPGVTMTDLRLLPQTILYFYKVAADGQNYEADGAPYSVPQKSGVACNLPLSEVTAEQLIASGKIDIHALSSQIAASLIEAKNDANSAKACWKDTKVRGAGIVPRLCPPGQHEDTAGLCYDDCRPGYYSNKLTMCIPTCPANFRDDGLYCYKPGPITRDAYPWKFGDGLSMDDAMERCRRDHGNNCVTANANTMVYSTCPANYEQAPVITNLCTPTCPANTIDMGISCQKNTYDRGVGHLMQCGSGMERDAGLCYKACDAGYNPVGPVCWHSCPAKLPVNCGASCAATEGDCAQSITDQVTSPVMVAANVALIAVTAGGAAAATPAEGAAEAAAKTGSEVASKEAAEVAGKEAFKASVKAAIKSGLVQSVKAGAKAVAIDQIKQAAISGAISGAVTVGMSESAISDLREQLRKQIDQELANNVSDAEIDTIVNEAMAKSGSDKIDFDWSSLDPTGVASVVTAYNLPMCSDLK